MYRWKGLPVPARMVKHQVPSLKAFGLFVKIVYEGNFPGGGFCRTIIPVNAEKVSITMTGDLNLDVFDRKRRDVNDLNGRS